MQQQSYPEELEFLLDPAGRTVPRLVLNLDLLIDGKGLIKSGDRIGRLLHFNMEVKHAILLAKLYPIIRLIIMDCHIRCQHLGVGSTKAKLRRHCYWVSKRRKTWNTMPDKFCLLLHPTYSLHAWKVIVSFKYTGVDFTGHLWVRQGGSEVKMYLLIFICLRVGAVHIEVEPDRGVLFFLHQLVWHSDCHLQWPFWRGGCPRGWCCVTIYSRRLALVESSPALFHISLPLLEVSGKEVSNLWKPAPTKWLTEVT